MTDDGETGGLRVVRLKRVELGPRIPTFTLLLVVSLPVRGGPSGDGPDTPEPGVTRVEPVTRRFLGQSAVRDSVFRNRGRGSGFGRFYEVGKVGRRTEASLRTG